MVTQCIIMPPIAAVFTVKEHILLRTIIYLFQFLLCLIQVILAYRRLWNRLRWQHSIIDLTTIRRIRDSHYHLNNPLSTQHNNVNNGLYLPNQPCLWHPVIQHLQPPRHPPPGNHQFLHYQSHIWYTATTSLPLNTSAANQRERQTIIEFLKEECAHIKTLKWLLNMVDNNATKLHSLFEDSPISNNVNWGEVNWGPVLQWEQLPPPPQDEWCFGYPICVPQ